MPRSQYALAQPAFPFGPKFEPESDPVPRLASTAGLLSQQARVGSIGPLEPDESRACEQINSSTGLQRLRDARDRTSYDAK